MFSINGKLFRTLSKAGDFFILEFLESSRLFFVKKNSLLLYISEYRDNNLGCRK